MNASIYKVQCITFAVAQKIAGDFRSVTHGDESNKAPFCLRKVQACRDEHDQAFRDLVAKQVWLIRSGEKV